MPSTHPIPAEDEVLPLVFRDAMDRAFYTHKHELDMEIQLDAGLRQWVATCERCGRKVTWFPDLNREPPHGLALIESCGVEGCGS